MPRPSPASTGTRVLALALASGVIASACGGSTPAASLANGATATAGATVDGSPTPGSIAIDVSEQEAAARSDPSLERLATFGQALDAAIAEESRQVEALGPVIVEWLSERRTATAIAALEADGIEPPATGLLHVSSEPIAAVGPFGQWTIGQWGMTWVGAVIVGPAMMLGGMGQIGSSASSTPEPTTSHDSRTEGNLRVDADTTTARSMSVSGSTVIVDVDVTQTSTTTDTSTGAQVGTGSYRTHIHAEVDVCPDANGVVVLHLQTDIASRSGGEPGFEAHSTLEQRGQVGDDAWLATETETEQIDISTTSATGERRDGTVRRSLTTANRPDGGGFARVLGGTGNVTGSMSSAEADGWVSAIKVVTATTIALALRNAQERWRNGKCVTITATERSRDVAPNEVVPFTATPRHVIEGVDLDKPVEAALTGVRSVAPANVRQDPPASITYTAPAEIDAGGTVNLTSTSNRGIGKLALTFRVKAPNWFVDHASGGGRIKGIKCGGIGGDWIVTGTYQRSVGGLAAKGRQRWVITIDEATQAGTYTYSDRQTSTAAGIEIYVTAEIQGTVTLTIDAGGRALMAMVQTSHQITSTTSVGGQGSVQNAPLDRSKLDWEVGGTC